MFLVCPASFQRWRCRENAADICEKEDLRNCFYNKESTQSSVVDFDRAYPLVFTPLLHYFIHIKTNSLTLADI